MEVSNRLRGAIVGIISLVAVAAAGVSQAAPLAANLLRGTLADPDTAWGQFPASNHSNGVAAWSTPPPELMALARTLGNGRATDEVYTKNVFEYVRNNIETEFRFGLGKGARGAVIDQSGTPFDQAELMVKLLRMKGIAADYEIGKITLDAQQFAKWTGIFNSVDEVTQVVTTVNAQAACQLLADGAIPGSCSPASGNLTEITLAHIWVKVGSKQYDPSFKESKLYDGYDIPAWMGCGSLAASTCGDGMTNAAKNSYLSGTTTVTGPSGTATGVPYVQRMNETQLNSWLQNAGQAVQTQVQNTNRLASLEQITGGRELVVSPLPETWDSLPYDVEPRTTWPGDQGISDSFRTRLRVRFNIANIARGTNAMADQWFFADELAGRRLQLTMDAADPMQLDGVTVTPLTSCNTCDTVMLDIDHPYPTAGYGDEAQVFHLNQLAANFVNFPNFGTVPVTIVHGLGNASPSTETHYAGLQELLPRSYFVSYDVPGAGNHTRNEITFENKEQPLIAIRALVQGAEADRLISGISKSAIIRHHHLGIAYAHSASPGSLNNLSIEPSISVVSSTADNTSRLAAFETSASTFATIEGMVNQNLNASEDGISVPTMFWSANQAVNGVRQRYFEMTSLQLQAAYGSGSSSWAQAGYSAVMPENAASGIIFRPGAVGHLVGEMKGGAAVTSDPLGRAMDTIKVQDLASARKKYLSVSPADGAATIKATDLVTGVGDFPHALPFTRTYTSGATVDDRYSYYELRGYTLDSSEQQWGTNTYSHVYSGPDSAANARIGGGWNHNYNVTANYSGNGMKALGQDYALEATASIAALRAIYDAARAPSLAGRVTSMLASRWLSKTHWAFNSVVVNKGGSNEVFHRLPNGTFFTPAGSARLTKSGEPTIVYDFSGVSFTYTGSIGDTIVFTPAFYSRVPTCCGAPTKAEPVFKADDWTFPDGTNVHFTYTYESLINGGEIAQEAEGTICTRVEGSNCRGGATDVPMGWVLQSVSNNLGRTLTFTRPPTYIKTWVGNTSISVQVQNRTSRFPITSVTDDSGRSVSFNWSGCEAMWKCEKLTVTGSDSRDTVYSYAPAADSVNPSVFKSLPYRLRRWHLPSDTALSSPFQVLAYDELFRVKTIKDALGNYSYVYAGGVAGTERWKRSELVSSVGAVTVQVFDDHNSAIKATDPLGRVTTTTYDRANRSVLTTFPEGNSTENAYDIRSNLTSAIVSPKPSTSGYLPVTTSSTFPQATSTNCTNWKTCNQPSSTTDARGRTTNYTYSSASGQVLTILAPAVPLPGSASNVRPLKTLCYARHNGSSLLTGTIDKVDTAVNRVRTFAYSSANKYVLQTVKVDPNESLLPPAPDTLECTPSTKAGLNYVTTLSFDSVGNLQSIDGPRTDASDVTNYTFDRARRITRITAPLGSTSRYCYDADGLLRGTHRGRIDGVADPNAPSALIDGSCPSAYPAASWQSETRDYWATGDLKVTQDPEGNATRYAYDEDGNSRVVQDPDGRQVASVYDLAGQLVATWKGGRGWIDGNGMPSTTAPNRDSSWNPQTYVDAGYVGPVRFSSHVYTPNGKLWKMLDGANNLSENIYDGLDRLFFTFFPNASDGTRCTIPGQVTAGVVPTCSASSGKTPTYESSTYDENSNRLTSRTRGGGIVTQTFDSMNRVRTKAVSGGTPALPTVTYAYKLTNEPTALTSPVRGNIPIHETRYDYDAAGRKLFEENTIAARTWRVSYGWDEASNRNKVTWPDGYFVFYKFDALNRMEYAYENSMTTNEIAYYKLDPLSRREQLRLGGQTTNRVEYLYEPDSQLDVLTNVLNGTTVRLDYGRNSTGQINGIEANDAFYLPSPANTSLISYAPNKLNQYDNVGGEANPFTYDTNGNLLTWFRKGSKQTYTYDAENRLRSAAVNGATIASITHDYDNLGRRVSKTVGGEPTYYLLDGDEEIAEYRADGVLLRRYLMGPNIDDRIAHVEVGTLPTPVKTFYHVNHQGSVIATTSADGSAVEVLAYDEYGNLTSQPPAQTTGEVFRYTGRRFDAESSLYYYRARYYAPEVGRFLQADPVGYRAGPNLYEYAGSDPLNKNDPSGLWLCDTKRHGSECMKVAVALSTLRDAAKKFKAGSAEQNALNKVIKLYGKFGEKGVNVKFGESDHGVATAKLSSDKQSVDVTVDTAKFSKKSGIERAAVMAHEGQHGVDGLAAVAAGNLKWGAYWDEHQTTEENAYRTQSYVNEAFGVKSAYAGLWGPGVSPVDRDNAIKYWASESAYEVCRFANNDGCAVRLTK